jgi:hypothetical protein
MELQDRGKREGHKETFENDFHAHYLNCYNGSQVHTYVKTY